MQRPGLPCLGAGALKFNVLISTLANVVIALILMLAGLILVGEILVEKILELLLSTAATSLDIPDHCTNCNYGLQDGDTNENSDVNRVKLDRHVTDA